MAFTPRTRHVVLVCGGSAFTGEDDVARVLQVLDQQHQLRRIDTIVCGGERGADGVAASWAKANSVGVLSCDDPWAAALGVSGTERLRAMLRVSKADTVVLFPGGGAARRMLELAREAQLVVELG